MPHPVPRVVSRFLRLTPLGESALGPGELARLEPWLRAAFGHRRKTIRGALRAADAADPGPALTALGIAERTRPGELDPEAWLQLARRLADDQREAESTLAR